MLRICAEHLTDDAEHQSVAVLGIALVVLGEDVGTEVRAFLESKSSLPHVHTNAQWCQCSEELLKLSLQSSFPLRTITPAQPYTL